MAHKEERNKARARRSERPERIAWDGENGSPPTPSISPSSRGRSRPQSGRESRAMNRPTQVGAWGTGPAILDVQLSRSPSPTPRPSKEFTQVHSLEEVNDKDKDKAQVPEDAESVFHDLVRQVTEEHDKVLEELRLENSALKEKLNSVLTSTWTLGQEGGLNGAPMKPKYGELELICLPGAANKTEANSFRVPKERVLAQFDKGPNAFPVRDGWTPLDDFTKEMQECLKDDFGKKPRKRNSMENRLQSQRTIRLIEEEEEVEGPPPGRFVISPASNKRLGWDAISLVLIIWDMFAIPISMYGLQDVLFMIIMDWVTLLFWSSDIIASLLTGLLRDGAYVMDTYSIRINYFKTWFLIDMIILLPDWAMTIIGLVNGGANQGNVLGIVRIFRVVRIIRLLRLAKMKRIVTRIKDMIANEFVFVVLSFVQSILAIFVVNHFFGAFYYFIGDTLSRNDRNNWIDKITLAEEPLFNRYLTAFKWSFTKFSMGTNNVESISPVELAFELLTMLIGMIVFCPFTASIANWITQAKQLRGEYPKQVWLLRRYLKQNGVSSELTERLHYFLEGYEKRLDARVNVQRLSILNWLTDSLRLELQYLTSYSKFTCNPTMAYVESYSMPLMHQLCGTAARVKSVVEKEAIFTKDTVVSFMCVIDTGACSYSMKQWAQKVVLEKDAYFCESAFWVNWTCRGDLIANTDGQIIYMDVKPFMDLMSANAQLFATMSAYGSLYSEWLGSIEEEEMTDVFLNHRELFTCSKNDRKHAVILKQAWEKVRKLEFEDE